MDLNLKKSTLDISVGTIIKIALALLFIWFLYVIRSVLIVLFVAFIIASIMEPVASWFQRRKWPLFRHRGIAAILIYLFLLIIVSLVVGLLIPPIIEQIGELSKSFPAYWEKLTTGFESLQSYSDQAGISGNVQKALKSLETGLGETASGVFSTLFTVFGGIVSFFIILVVAFYIVVEEDAIKGIARYVVPDKYLPYLTQLVHRVQQKVGAWGGGQAILCLIIGVLSYFGLLALGVKYALVLALLAGLLELVPYLGPIMAAIPAVFLAFMQSPLTGVLVLILYIIIQQLENQILVPQVMKRAVGLNPIISITALLIGAELAGFVGVVLAIPTATVLSVVLKDIFDKSEEKT